MIAREKIVEEHKAELLRMFEGVVHHYLREKSDVFNAMSMGRLVVFDAVSALVDAAEEEA